MEQTEKDISDNHISSNFLDIMGMKDEYASYLLNVERKVTVINSKVYQTSDGVWHNTDEANTNIENYKKLWYYVEYRR